MKKYIFGNFKMNKTLKECEIFVEKFEPLVVNSKNEIAIFPSFVNLFYIKQKLANSKILVGAQNVASEAEGAFTGEVSAKMLKDINSDYVIVGHSERRKLFLEKNDCVNKKVKEALGNGLKVVLCLGETKYERQSNKFKQVIEKEVSEALKGLYENELKHIIIAYEPVWAIGTGKVPTVKNIEEMAGIIRDVIAHEYSEKASKNMKILYGGSVKSSNAKNFANAEGINGLLVGGASLDAEEFARICNIK